MMATVFVSILSYFLKALPFLSDRFQGSGTSFLARSVEYAVCFIMGAIIVNVAFGNASASHLMERFGLRECVVLLTILASFLVCRLTGSILKSLFVSMALFVVSMWGLS